MDDLRVKTNPKMQYGGQILGAYKPNQSGIHGRVENIDLILTILTVKIDG